MRTATRWLKNNFGLSESIRRRASPNPALLSAQVGRNGLSAGAGPIDAFMPPAVSLPSAAPSIPDVAQLRPEHVELLALAPDTEEKTHGWRELPDDDASRNLLHAMQKQAWEAVGISSHPPATRAEAERLEGLTREHFTLRPNPALERAFRLKHVEGRSSFVVEPGTGRVLLRERLGARPHELKRADPRAAGKLLGQFVKETPPEHVKAWADVAARWLPPDALEFVSRTGVRIELLARGGYSRYLKEYFGKAYDPKKMPDPDAVGAYARGANWLAYIDEPYANPLKKGEVVTHELIHVIDFALGTDGRPLSASPEWKSIYERIHAIATDGKHPFPPAYPLSSQQELFAYFGSLMLGPCANWEGDVWTRADLARLDGGRAYEFMKKVFSEHIPHALHSGHIQNAETALAQLDTQVRRVFRNPFKRLSPKAWADYMQLKGRRYFLSLDRGDYWATLGGRFMARWLSFAPWASEAPPLAPLAVLAQDVKQFRENFLGPEPLEVQKRPGPAAHLPLN